MDNSEKVLLPEETDAIGEVLNISMGSAATAISTLLDKRVVITTPTIGLKVFKDINYESMEPALVVKIEYVEGISGSNVMVFKQSDMQVILNLMMGSDEPPSDDFVFDEMSMSAACEVMNQMMGSAATALSEILSKPINISTPQAFVMASDESIKEASGLKEDDIVTTISFNLDIEGVMQSEFISLLPIDLSKMIVRQLMGEIEDTVPAAPAPAPQPAPSPAAPTPVAPAAQPAQPAQQAPAPEAAPPAMGAAPGAAPSPTPPPAQPQTVMDPSSMTGMTGMMGMAGQAGAAMPGQAAAMAGQMPGQAPGQLPPGYPPYGMPPYGMPPMYGMPGYLQQPAAPAAMEQPVNVQQAQFPSFAGQTPAGGAPLLPNNLGLVMNVPLNVSIEIGKTQRKIKEILDFNQGTVIELEKQAGAPVDVVVNGKLIAKGDVVVIGDNFGVRITEIIGTQELMNSLGKE